MKTGKLISVLTGTLLALSLACYGVSCGEGNVEDDTSSSAKMTSSTAMTTTAMETTTTKPMVTTTKEAVTTTKAVEATTTGEAVTTPAGRSYRSGK